MSDETTPQEEIAAPAEPDAAPAEQDAAPAEPDAAPAEQDAGETLKPAPKKTESIADSSNALARVNDAYTAADMEVLEGLEAPRRRPGMYIGDVTSGQGLHHGVFEVIDNSIDEAMAGHGNRIEVEIRDGEVISVKDHGRGIPVDIHPTKGVTALELAMGSLHAGGKMKAGAYKQSGGMNGVGLSVVNALSDYMIGRVTRDGGVWEIRYEKGVLVKPADGGSAVARVKSAPKGVTGTEIIWKPDFTIFTNVQTFSFETLATRFRELVHLNEGISILLRDTRAGHEREIELASTKGIAGYIEYLEQGNTPMKDMPAPFTFRHKWSGKAEVAGDEDGTMGVLVDVALTWQPARRGMLVRAFANNIPQRDGGTHVDGFSQAVGRAILRYFQTNEIKTKATITADDARDGIVAVVSVKLDAPSFSSQTKDKLVTREARSAVHEAVYQHVLLCMENDPIAAKAIVAHVTSAADGREAADRARQDVKESGPSKRVKLTGKLVDCSSNDVAERELYLVEGDSAGGTTKEARNKKTQAVLPLRGKITNVMKASDDKVDASQEIATIIAAMGTGMGDRFNLDRRRYDKIVIATDADVDGEHIRILLITHFHQNCPGLIEGGHLYVAQPPLYRANQGKKGTYLLNDEKRDAWINEQVAKLVTTRWTPAPVKDVVAPEPMTGTGEALVAAFTQVKAVQALVRQASHLMSPELAEATVLWRLAAQALGGDAKVPRVVDYLNRIAEPGIVWTISQDEQKRIVFTHDDCGILRRHVYDPSVKTLDGLAETHLAADNPVVQLFTGHLSLQRGGKLAQARSLNDIVLVSQGLATQGVDFNRYKGLGEMNVPDLRETAMDPKTRGIYQVAIVDAMEAETTLAITMSDDVEARFQYIMANAVDAVLDV